MGVCFRKEFVLYLQGNLLHLVQTAGCRWFFFSEYCIYCINIHIPQSSLRALEVSMRGKRESSEAGKMIAR